MIQFNEFLPTETMQFFTYYIKFPDILNLGSDENEMTIIKGLITGKIKVTEENLNLVIMLKNECFKKIEEIETFSEKAKSNLNEIHYLKWNK